MSQQINQRRRFFSTAPNTRFGYNSELGADVASRLQIVGEASGHYYPQSDEFVFGMPVQLTTRSYVFGGGPRLYLGGNEYARPFFNVLFGAHHTREKTTVTVLETTDEGIIDPAMFDLRDNVTNGFRLVVGGGIDVGDLNGFSFRLKPEIALGGGKRWTPLLGQRGSRVKVDPAVHS